MRKGSTPGQIDKAPGVDSMKVRAGITLVSSSGSGIINLAPTTRRHVLSKREMVPHPTVNFVLTELSEGRAVSEIDTYNHSTSRFRRAESLTVLKEIHRRYPQDTELAVIGGLFVLVPVQRGTP